MIKVKPRYTTVNPKAGISPELKFEYPEGFLLIIDTREQKESDHLFKMRRKGLASVFDTLETGDYSVRGFEGSGIIFERKTISDLFTSLGNERDRFKAELERMKGFERKYLVIHGKEEEALQWNEFSKMHPNSIRQSLVSIEIKLNVMIHFEPSKDKLERFVLDRMIKFYKIKRQGK